MARACELGRAALASHTYPALLESNACWLLALFFLHAVQKHAWWVADFQGDPTASAECPINGGTVFWIAFSIWNLCIFIKKLVFSYWIKLFLDCLFRTNSPALSDFSHGIRSQLSHSFIEKDHELRVVVSWSVFTSVLPLSSVSFLGSMSVLSLVVLVRHSVQ